MSSSTLRVELPAYSHSFHVPVTPLSTIRDLKHEIAKVCPGSPKPDGQRVIWKGRLLEDEEKVEDLWKSPDESRVVHLAVNPSAWTSSPPSQPSPAAPTRSPPTHPPRPVLLQTPLPQPNSMPVSPLLSLSYVQHLHHVALSVLSPGAISLPTQAVMAELETCRSSARDIYRARGWTWPSLFDEPFPSGSTDQGALYQSVTIEGLPYLQLTTPDTVPTAAQLHAFKVLTHTFPVLSMASDPMLYTPANIYPHPLTPPTNLNQRLQQLGIPVLRVAQNQVVNLDANPLAQPGAGVVEIRAIPLRALMVPLLMLAFRALLILYFFSPTKRPVFGVVLGVWILYETWVAMRLVLNEGNAGGAEAAGANPAVPNAAPAHGQPAPNPVGVPGNNVNGPTQNPTPSRSILQGLVDYLSTMDLAAEDAMLDTDSPHPPPGLLHKAKMFIVLFFVTLYPAAWDRRRTAMRRREGRIRTEANAREVATNQRADTDANGDAEGSRQAQSEEERAAARSREQLVARHERRPMWLREYVDRVQYTEWVDDP